MLFNTIKKKIKYCNGYSEQTAVPCECINGEIVGCCRDIQNHESSKCWVLVTENFIYLQSYKTIVSKFDRETGIIEESKHSVTTSRQQTWFAYDLGTKVKSRKVVDRI